jgi:hypothetical protein
VQTQGGVGQLSSEHPALALGVLRTENFFLCNGHLVGDVSEDGGFDVEALVTVAVATRHQLGTLMLSNLDVPSSQTHVFTLVLISTWINTW